MSTQKNSQLSIDDKYAMIQLLVGSWLVSLGYTECADAFYRIVDTDMAQVVELKLEKGHKSCNGALWVNLGIYIPECANLSFDKSYPEKNNYCIDECTIHGRLGLLADNKDTCYDLENEEKPNNVATDIEKRLKKYVFPIFDMLTSRDVLLRGSKNITDFNALTRPLTKLEEAMIIGRRGDFAGASDLFCKYYIGVLQQEQRRLAEVATLEKLKNGKYKLPNGAVFSPPKESQADKLRTLAAKLGIMLDSE